VAQEQELRPSRNGRQAALSALVHTRTVGGWIVTVEAVALIDSHTIAVMNDNNFPGTGGRSATQPDENEYLEISLDQPLEIDRRLLPHE
jgi:hypothetical protein